VAGFENVNPLSVHAALWDQIGSDLHPHHGAQALQPRDGLQRLLELVVHDGTPNICAAQLHAPDVHQAQSAQVAASQPQRHYRRPCCSATVHARHCLLLHLLHEADQLVLLQPRPAAARLEVRQPEERRFLRQLAPATPATPATTVNCHKKVSAGELSRKRDEIDCVRQVKITCMGVGARAGPANGCRSRRGELGVVQHRRQAIAGRTAPSES
jgi:hypothetical protein